MNGYQVKQLARMNGTMAAASLSDVLTLRVLHAVFADRLEQARRATQVRRAFINQIRTLAEDGKIALVESGMDCDGVRYSGSVRIVDATVAAVDAAIEHATDWADGPIYFGLEAPSVAAAEIEYESRDLVMEAFENGHPYSLHV